MSAEEEMMDGWMFNAILLNAVTRAGSGSGSGSGQKTLNPRPTCLVKGHKYESGIVSQINRLTRDDLLNSFIKHHVSESSHSHLIRHV